MTNAELLDAISILLDWRSLGPIAATVKRERGTSSILSEVQFDPALPTWRIRTGGEVFARSADGTYAEQRDGAPIASIDHRPDYIPMDLWLLHPVSLPIWGRPGDDWRITDVETKQSTIEIALAHHELPQLAGRVTIDRDIRLPIEFSTPAETVRLSRVESFLAGTPERR